MTVSTREGRGTRAELDDGGLGTSKVKWVGAGDVSIISGNVGRGMYLGPRR